MFFIVHHLIWQEWTSDFPFLRFYVIPCRKSIFCFQVINYSCGLDSLMVYLAAGCVIDPEIVVFQELKVFQQLQAPWFTSESAESENVFSSLALLYRWTLCCLQHRLLCEAHETEVPSLLTKVALVAECDRMWILLVHCVCRRWQRTWDLIKIYLEGDHSSTRPNLEKWLSSTWQT